VFIDLQSLYPSVTLSTCFFLTISSEVCQTFTCEWIVICGHVAALAAAVVTVVTCHQQSVLSTRTTTQRHLPTELHTSPTTVDLPIRSTEFAQQSASVTRRPRKTGDLPPTSSLSDYGLGLYVSLSAYRMTSKTSSWILMAC